MSLIGPRPLTQETFDLFNSDQAVVKSVVPGSGIGLTIFRDEEIFSHAKKAKEIYREEIAPFKGSEICIQETEISIPILLSLY